MIKDIDAALELGPYLAGEKYSLADAALTPYVHRLWLLGCEELWLKSRPKVGEWYDNMKARSSFEEVFIKHENHTQSSTYWPHGTEKNKYDWNRYEIEENFFKKYDSLFLNRTILHYKKWAKKLWK